MADVGKSELKWASPPLHPGGRSTRHWQEYICLGVMQAVGTGRDAAKLECIVVLLQLCNKQVRKAKTLSDLLYNSTYYANKLVIEHITSARGEGVMIIFDGYDELSEEYMTEDSIFHQLLYKKCLSQCTVMVTSHPVANSRLYNEFKNTCSEATH